MQLGDEWSIVIAVMGVPQTIAAGRTPTCTDLTILKQHPLLTSAASKLQWAQSNLAAFAYNIGQSFKNPSDFAVLDADRDPEAGDYIFRVKAQPPLDDFAENFSHAIADIAKNIRSVYDKLAWSCANDFHQVARKDRNTVYFPIQTSLTAYEGLVAEAAMFNPDHWTFFEKFQPYHGNETWSDHWFGDYVHPITLVNRLANDDKHTDTQPVLMGANQFTFRRFDYVQSVPNEDYPGPFTWTGLNQPLKVGLEMLRVGITDTAEPHINDAARALPNVSLPEGRLAVPTMERLYSFAHLVLSEFALEFPAP